MSAPEKRKPSNTLLINTFFHPGKQLGVMSQMLEEHQTLLNGMLANKSTMTLTPADIQKQISALRELHQRFTELCKKVSHTENYQQINAKFVNFLEQYASLLPKKTFGGPKE